MISTLSMALVQQYVVPGGMKQEGNAVLSLVPGNNGLIRVTLKRNSVNKLVDLGTRIQKV